MRWLAATDSTAVPTALVIALVAVTLPLVIALLAWIVRELARTSSVLTKLEERSEDHERRLTRLEG